MSNADVILIAKANLLAKKDEQGYVQLVTDCWGLVVEYELEWHRQNGGTSQVNNANVTNYSSHDKMIQEFTDRGASVDSILNTMGWDKLEPGSAKQDGDMAVCTMQGADGQDACWTVWLWNTDAWETSIERSHELVRARLLPMKYHWRKRVS